MGVNMFQLTKQHIPRIKQLLVEKMNLDERGNGKEIRFDEAVLQEMKRHRLSKSKIYKCLRDVPIRTLRPLNQRFSRYLVGIDGNYGGIHVRMEIEMVVDKSGLDFRITKLTVKH